jgi:hypothetical protein
MVGKSQKSLSHHSNELSDLVLENSRLIILRYAPCLLHHSHEIVVAWDACCQVSVVVNELLLGDLTVVVSLGSIKRIQELVEKLLFSL